METQDLVLVSSGNQNDLTNYLQLVDKKQVSQLQMLRGGKQIVVNIAFDSDKTTFNQLGFGALG